MGTIQTLHVPEVRPVGGPTRGHVLAEILRSTVQGRAHLFYYDGRMFMIRLHGVVPTSVDLRRKRR